MQLGGINILPPLMLPSCFNIYTRFILDSCCKPLRLQVFQSGYNRLQKLSLAQLTALRQDVQEPPIAYSLHLY